MFDWNVGYGSPDWYIRVGGAQPIGGGYPTYPTQPIYYPPVGGVGFGGNNQLLWMLLIIGGAVLLLKD